MPCPSPDRSWGHWLCLGQELGEITTTRSSHFWLCIYRYIYISITQGIQAESCSAYSWARGQTCNMVCQPKDVTCVFTQTLCWQLTGFWPHSPTSPGQKCWAENQITSQLHLVRSPQVFKCRGVMACAKDHPFSQPCPQRGAKDGEPTW